MMNLIPTDATLVRGSHGRCASSSADGPLLMSDQRQLIGSANIGGTDVFGTILTHLTT